VGRSLILDADNMCVGCFKIMHLCYGREIDEYGNKLYFVCDAKPKPEGISVDSVANISDVIECVLTALEEEEELPPSPSRGV
jgi:hypothetical protein